MNRLRLLSLYAVAAYGDGARGLWWPPLNDDAPISLDTPVIGDDWLERTLEEWLEEQRADLNPIWRARVLSDLAERGCSRGGEAGDPESWYVHVAPETMP